MVVLVSRLKTILCIRLAVIDVVDVAFVEMLVVDVADVEMLVEVADVEMLVVVAEVEMLFCCGIVRCQELTGSLLR